MLAYRSLTYYFFVSLFVMSLFFGGFTGSFRLSQLFPSKKHYVLKNSLVPKPNYQLVELMDNVPTDMTKQYVLSPKSSRGENKSLSTINNSTAHMGAPVVNPSMDQSMKKQENAVKALDKLKMPDLSPNGDIAFNKPVKDISKTKTTTKTLGSHGTDTEHVNIRMDSKGNFSVNAKDYKNAQYLIAVAKGIFYYWVQFIPFNLVYQGYIKTDSPGIMQALVEFKNDGKGGFTVDMRKAFISNNLDEMTKNAFNYYTFPTPPPGDKVQLQVLLAQFTIHQDTLQVEANFDFEVK